MKSLLPAALLVLLTSCRGTEVGEPTTPPGTAPTIDALTGTWTLEELDGRDVDPATTLRAPELTLDGEGQLSGFSGVNRITGRVDMAALAQGRFEAGPLATTRRAGPPVAMELEKRYLQALDRASFVQLEDGVLQLSGGGKVLARFTPAP